MLIHHPVLGPLAHFYRLRSTAPHYTYPIQPLVAPEDDALAALLGEEVLSALDRHWSACERRRPRALEVDGRLVLFTLPEDPTFSAANLLGDGDSSQGGDMSVSAFLATVNALVADDRQASMGSSFMLAYAIAEHRYDYSHNDEYLSFPLPPLRSGPAITRTDRPHPARPLAANGFDTVVAVSDTMLPTIPSIIFSDDGHQTSCDIPDLPRNRSLMDDVIDTTLALSATTERDNRYAQASSVLGALRSVTNTFNQATCHTNGRFDGAASVSIRNADFGDEWVSVRGIFTQTEPLAIVPKKKKVDLAPRRPSTASIARTQRSSTTTGLRKATMGQAKAVDAVTRAIRLVSLQNVHQGVLAGRSEKLPTKPRTDVIRPGASRSGRPHIIGVWRP